MLTTQTNHVPSPSVSGDTIIDEMHDGYCELASDGCLVKVNTALCEMTGYSEAELIGCRPPYPFWPDEDREALLEQMKTPVGRGISHNVTFCRKNGERFQVIVCPSVVINNDGEVVSFFATIKDISHLMISLKRKRMLSLVADKTTDAVVVTGPDFRIVWVNDAFERLTGYTLEEIEGKVPGKVLQGPKTSAASRRYIREQLKKKQSVALEILNYAKDGTEYWLDLNINPVFDEQGELEFFIAVERDVTSKKEAEFALRTAMEQLEEIQQIAKIGHWEMRFDTGQIDLSEACFDIYGIDRSSFKPTIRHLMKYIHTEDVATLRDAMSKVYETGGYDQVYRVVRSDGGLRYVQERSHIVHDPVHEIDVLRGTVQDIDTSVRARMERETLNEVRQVIDNSPVVHFKLSMRPSGNIHFDYISKSVNQLDPTLDADKLMSGEQSTISALGPQRFAEVVKELAASAECNKPLRMALVFDGTGTQVHMELFAVPEVTEYKQLVWYGHIQDVTPVFQRNLELERYATVTESQNRRLLEFAQVLSHNVRLHTSTMSGLITAIGESTDADENELLHTYLKQTSEKLDDTLHDLNDVLTIRGSDLSDLKQICLAEVLNIHTPRWERLCKEAGGEFSVCSGGNFDRNVYQDLLVPVLDELINNAIRFRSPERLLQISLACRLNITKSEIDITVSDNGTGFDAKRNASYVFGMYRTFHSEHSGKGIGLFLARNRAEAMMGDLSLESGPDKGTVVTLSIPV